MRYTVTTRRWFLLRDGPHNYGGWDFDDQTREMSEERLSELLERVKSGETKLSVVSAVPVHD